MTHQTVDTNQILLGDCIDSLRLLPDKYVHTCVTSPPYYGLRDYGMDGQIGLEVSPDAFVARLVEVFREVWRVLRDDGTLWLNLGDSYAANRTYQVEQTKGGPKHGAAQAVSGRGQRASDYGLKPKDLIGIPWRVAFALQADGWYLRQDIIWHKPNPMPESVRDRCTKAHEYIFLFSKSPKYFFDCEAMREPGGIPAGTKGAKGSVERAAQKGVNGRPPEYKVYDGMRNRRSVWSVTTKPFRGAHFATYPPDLIAPCILAGAPSACCASCGSPHVPQHERSGEVDSSHKGSRFDIGKTGKRTGGDRAQPGARTIKSLLGYAATCSCDVGAIGGIVLDPFFGSGTTGLVAHQNGRRWIGCELNPNYAKMAERRLTSVPPVIPDDLRIWLLAA